MSAYQFIGIILSLIAVVISIHTKYKQREKNDLKNVASKLKRIQSLGDDINRELRNPRSHEDLELRLYEIPREILTCQYETQEDEVHIATSVETGYGKDAKELDTSQEVSNRYKGGEFLHLQVKIGNLDEFYISNRQFTIQGPFRYSSQIYDRLPEIEEEYGSILNEFDENLLQDFESQLDTMLERHANHLCKEAVNFSIDVSTFKSTRDIGTEVFNNIYYYEAIEDDLEEFEDILAKVEETRITILQTGYS